MEQDAQGDYSATINWETYPTDVVAVSLYTGSGVLIVTVPRPLEAS